jgi:hypothetical protein
MDEERLEPDDSPEAELDDDLLLALGPETDTPEDETLEWLALLNREQRR